MRNENSGPVEFMSKMSREALIGFHGSFSICSEWKHKNVSGLGGGIICDVLYDTSEKVHVCEFVRTDDREFIEKIESHYLLNRMSIICIGTISDACVIKMSFDDRRDAIVVFEDFNSAYDEYKRFITRIVKINYEALDLSCFCFHKGYINIKNESKYYDAISKSALAIDFYSFYDRNR